MSQIETLTRRAGTLTFVLFQSERNKSRQNNSRVLNQTKKVQYGNYNARASRPWRARTRSRGRGWPAHSSHQCRDRYRVVDIPFDVFAAFDRLPIGAAAKTDRSRAPCDCPLANFADSV